MSEYTANSAKPESDKDGDEEERVNSQEARPHERVLKRIFSPTLCSSFWCRTCRTSYSMNREPKDRFNLVYLCMLTAGAGFLLPWSSYISAIDYFFFLYRTEFSTVSEAIPLTYLLTTLLFSTINIGLVGLISIHWRIRFGYIMFACSLVFIPLLDIGINNCTVSTHVSYYLTLLTIVAVGLGSGGECLVYVFQCFLSSLTHTHAHTHTQAHTHIHMYTYTHSAHTLSLPSLYLTLFCRSPHTHIHIIM